MSDTPSVTPASLTASRHPAPEPACYNALYYTPALPDGMVPFPKLQQINEGNPTFSQTTLDAVTAATTDFFIDFESWTAAQPPSDADITALAASFAKCAALKKPGLRMGWYYGGGSGALNPWAQTNDPTGELFFRHLKALGVFRHVDFLGMDWYYFQTQLDPTDLTKTIPANGRANGEVTVWAIRAMNAANCAKAAGVKLVLFECPHCDAFGGIGTYDPAGYVPVDYWTWYDMRRLEKALIDRGDVWRACLWDWNTPGRPINTAPLFPLITAAVNIYSGQKPTSISISPILGTLAAGAAQKFTATVYDQFGNAFFSPLTWHASAGTIDQSGQFTAPANGTVIIQATAGSVVATLNVVIQ